MSSAYKVYNTQGFIYKVVSNNVSDLIYIGSTSEKLSSRMKKHRSAYTSYHNDNKTGKTTVYDIFDTFGIDNCTISLLDIKEPPYIKPELRKLEQEWIDKIECINKKPAFRSVEERRLYLQTYNQQPEVIVRNRENDKKSRDKPKNKERKKEYMSEYRKEYSQKDEKKEMDKKRKKRAQIRAKFVQLSCMLYNYHNRDREMKTGHPRIVKNKCKKQIQEDRVLYVKEYNRLENIKKQQKRLNNLVLKEITKDG